MSLPLLNLCKCKQVVNVRLCRVVFACLLVYPIFVYRCCSFFCLFVDHVNKFIAFGVFIYEFNNTICIFVTIFTIVNKLFTFDFALLFLAVYLYIPFFKQMLLLYFCLLFDHVSKPIIINPFFKLMLLLLI